MTPLLEMIGVDFAYAAPERRGRGFALSGVTFTVTRGEVLGVIGPNSAGKTTLIRLLTHVLEPARGEIRLDGAPLRQLGRGELARHVAVVPQDVPQGLPFTVEQVVLMGRYPHAPRRFFETEADLVVAREAMELTGVAHLAAAPVQSLSGGERQRAMLARALAQQPRLLVLDEPTAHLDLRYQIECARLLRSINRERGVTVLIVSHDLDLAAEVSDRLLLLNEGRVASLGPPVTVLQEELLSAVYRCPVVVDRHPVTGRPIVHVAWAPAHPDSAREGR